MNNKEEKSFHFSMGDSNNTNAVLGSVLFLIILGGGFWYFYGGGLEKQTKTELRNISNMVAEDAVKEYNIATKSGDKVSICVQAGFVSAAYLQAQDETNYLIWKEIEKDDCERAGVR